MDIQWINIVKLPITMDDVINKLPEEVRLIILQQLFILAISFKYIAKSFISATISLRKMKIPISNKTIGIATPITGASGWLSILSHMFDINW